MVLTRSIDTADKDSDSDSEQFICHTTTKNPYTCNQKIKIHYNICCADQETCIKINVDRSHVGHDLVNDCYILYAWRVSVIGLLAIYEYLAVLFSID